MATATYISGSSFSISGNVTTEFCVGRSIRCNCGTAGLFTGYISSSSYSTTTSKTTVVVVLDAGALTSQLSSVAHGNDTPTSMCRATQSSVGGVALAAPSVAVTGTDTTKAVTPATARQAVLSLLRDSMGKFPGIIPPSLNLFCGDAAPAGTCARSTTGTRLGQAGLIETVAAWNVRREWGSGGALQGWLIEASATNLFTYSEQLDNAAWSKSNCTVTANATASPAGDVTADKLVANTVSSAHLVRYFYSFLALTNYTISFFAKSSELSVITARVADGNSNFGTVHINLANGAKADGSTTLSLSTAVNDAGNGWWRISISFNLASVAASPYFDIVLSNAWPPTNNMGQVFAGDGVSGLYLWGAQLESNPFQTSYIPTTSAAVARSADVWTVPLATSWFNEKAGTIYIAGYAALGAAVSGAYQYFIHIDDGGYENRVLVRRDNNGYIRCYMLVGVSTVATLPPPGILTNGSNFRLAFSWSSSGISASLNGGACVTAATTALPSGLTTLRIGSDVAGSNQWGGHILHAAYFPITLSDTQLQAITL